MDPLIKNVPEGLTATFQPYTLNYVKPAGTSRGVLTEKQLWIISLTGKGSAAAGLGECSVIPGLSPDFTSAEQYELKLREVAENPSYFLKSLSLLADFSSIQFGLETAFLDWQTGGKQLLFDNPFTRNGIGTPINGLVWMGTEEYMREQIEAKIRQGYSCIKMKVGAIDFNTELNLLRSVRDRFPSDELTLRVDANGAFLPSEALEKLNKLADLDIHSIEQPIMAGQIAEMQQLCSQTPLSIALDEELIGINGYEAKMSLLTTISPQYIILKPSLHGGLTGCLEWIEIAESLQIPFWLTSALESNIGLTAIAQFAGNFSPDIPQGLGTGGLYTWNFPSDLSIENGNLYFNRK